MRPPDHWHLRRSRRSIPWWPFAFAAVLFLTVLVFALHSAGGGTKHTSVSRGPSAPVCGAGSECVSPSASAIAGLGFPPPKLTAKSAAVLEVSCSALIYGQNAHERLPPASITKIATALVAIEHIDLDEVVDVRVNSALLVASTDSTVMGLEPGQRMSIRDLLYGMLLPSGNDAAIAIAQAVGGSETNFVDMMNARVAELGLGNTHFSNPHGLDEPGLYTTAFDMALLGRAALATPTLAAIVRTRSYQPAWDGPEVSNGDQLLDLYPDAIGIKTGYTEQAGQTIVAAAERNGRRLIVTLLGSSDRYADAIALFEWAFANTPPQC